jgi:hypothetical protein
LPLPQSDKKVIVGLLGNLLNEGFVALPAQPAEEMLGHRAAPPLKIFTKLPNADF